MNNRRMRDLELGVSKLTEQEVKEGWHFCPDWDGMLLGPDWPERESCYCNFDIAEKSDGSSKTA